MLPQEKFDVLRCLQRPFLGLKCHHKSLFEFWYSNRIFICFPSTHMVFGVHWQFQVHQVNHVKESCMQAGQSFASHLVWILFQGTTAAIELIICSVLRYQRLSLCSDHEICVGMDLCRRYACFLPASEGSVTPSQSQHWPSSCQVCWTN